MRKLEKRGGGCKEKGEKRVSGVGFEEGWVREVFKERWLSRGG